MAMATWAFIITIKEKSVMHRIKTRKSRMSKTIVPSGSCGGGESVRRGGVWTTRGVVKRI